MSTLRFLVTGDLQIHNWRPFSYIRPDGMNSRLHNCLKVFDILLEECERRKIDKVLLNGDILEESDYILVEVYNATYEKLERFHRRGIEVAISTGNHDISRQSSGRVLHSLRPFRKVATVLEKPTRIWNHVQVVPWLENPKELKEEISSLDADLTGALVLHAPVRGAVTGPSRYSIRTPIRIGDLRPHDFACVILSDFHTPQYLAKNVFYLGSPLQHNFGEGHSPSISAITLRSHPPFYKRELIHTSFPKFKRVEISKLRELKEKKGDLQGHYVCVKLRSDSKLSKEEVERWAHGKFMCDVVRESTDATAAVGASELNAHLFLRKYTHANARGGKAEILEKFGKLIYEDK